MQSVTVVTVNRADSVVLVTLLLLFSLTFDSAIASEPTSRQCKIIVDWEEEWELDENFNYSPKISHRYVVQYTPPFEIGQSPNLVDVSVIQIRDGDNILTLNDYNIISAGGQIDIILNSTPMFNDYISLTVESDEASCNRDLSMTIWNQPLEDHEVTRETDWFLSGSDNLNNQEITFEGRGWQKRTGDILESNELGNGSLFLNINSDIQNTLIDLNLDKVWLNETFEKTTLIKQDFEMSGSGLISLDSPNGEGLIVNSNIYEAYVNRSYFDGKMSERISLNGDGNFSLDGGDSESEGGFFGNIHVFEFETWDFDGYRRLQNTKLVGNSTARLTGASEAFSFNLDDFIYDEQWSEGIRINQHQLIKGSGDFSFLASDEDPYILFNGTIPNFHLESEGGETIFDTLIMDGTYSGDAEGSFGLVRKIEDSGTYKNDSGELHIADKIRNEYWFNVSATPFIPLNEELVAEHNLTFEYTSPQIDWENRTFRFTFVEDNGSVIDEYVPNSPIIRQADSPEANPIFSEHISRETGICPIDLEIGDKFPLIGNKNIILYVNTIFSSSSEVDGHNVSIMHWNGTYANGISKANGKIVNEGKLSGLLFEVNRELIIDLDQNNSQDIILREYQIVDRILYPSVITALENSPPSLDYSGNPPVSFREGILTTEGGEGHLEIAVFDYDTDMISVFVDLSELNLGIVELSDLGTEGDLKIHDGIWTKKITHSGLQHGNISINITLIDYWESVSVESSIMITNAPPRILSLAFNPTEVSRGDKIEIDVEAYDGHGIQSVKVDLMSINGQLIDLEKSSSEEKLWNYRGIDYTFISETWKGEFFIPQNIQPGKQQIPILISDVENASISTLRTGKIIANIGQSYTERVEIVNEPPTISNITIKRNQNEVDSIIFSSSGEPIEHTLEVEITDFDSVSSVQIRLGRLSPIGQSENWLLMKDDGLGPDSISNDGIYSIQFSSRSTLSEGEITINIRATDNFQSTTPAEMQSHVITISKEDSSSLDSSWFSDNSVIIIILSITIVMIFCIGLFVNIYRKSEL